MRATDIILIAVAVAGCATKSPYAYGVIGWNNEFSIDSCAPDTGAKQRTAGIHKRRMRELSQTR